MWELWRSRCNSRCEEEKPSIIRSTSLISFNICQLSKKTFTNLNIPENWENILKLMELSIVDTSSVPVRWLKPPCLFVKMNSNGSCVGNSTGGGGIVRDSMGTCLMAFLLPLGRGTNNTAETDAFIFGLRWCIKNGHSHIITETDSLLLRNCINNSWSTPLRIKESVKEIRILIWRHDVIINHYFKEANHVADKLPSMSHFVEEVKVFTQPSTIPRMIRGLLNVENWQFPSLRVKQRKPSMIFFEPP
ncbi:hypothetical protein R3W88_016038 [Solanum pinnatisectum]|uniref:RNase H type-1 domain-containing protein n=1 Tax=Solanum pinnatisectum TaxID=50273 RepID=A0AAV9KW94_9SOLN|nr:hypothetical protein R3W88_016038 [Solanum pinnatisectum]